MRQIYLSATMTMRPAMRVIRDRIHTAGLGRVVSSWIDADVDADAGGFKEAVRDLAELRSADLVIVDADGPPRSGGRETELGAAIGLRKSVWWVGPAWHPGMNIFLQLVPHFESWDDVMEELARDVEGVRDR